MHLKFICTIYLLLLVKIGFGQVEFAQLDGQLSKNEQFKEIAIGAEVSLKIKQDENVIYLNLQSEELLVASICISQGNEVYILHASAALGMMKYVKKENSNQWTTTDKFNWQLRETGLDESSIRKRSAYFETNKWVSNTMSMGVVGENELIIDKSLINNVNSFQLAAGLMPAKTPDEIISIPKGHEAGCANALLVSGDPKPSYDFLTRGWYKIELEP